MTDYSTAGTFSTCFATVAWVSALIVDTRLVAWACVVTATSNITQAIETYLICEAVVIAVAYRFTNATVAPFVAQAIRVASARGIARSAVTRLSR